MPDFEFERAIGGLVVGVDEAGRGPWCGPVSAGAAILMPDEMDPALLAALDDSKKLKPEKREELFERLQASPAILGVGLASVEEIDQLNILQATMLAMTRAVDDLGQAPDHALIDGNKAPSLACPAQTVVKGDAKSLSIAAASIVAKVTRDRIMTQLSEQHPGYGWDRNSGYGTKEHQEAIAKLGITDHHRRSFAPIRKIVEGS